MTVGSQIGRWALIIPGHCCVDRKTKARLQKLANAMDRTKSYVAAEAIRACVDLNEWQIGEIEAALKEAESGAFASERQVRAVMRKWTRGAH